MPDRRVSLRALLGAFLVCASSASMSAENWPQWRGPALNGTTGEKDLPIRWSKTENIAWTRDIQKDYGRFGLNWGYGSSPLLHDDALIVQVLHGMKTSDPSYLLRIDKASGKTVWRVERRTKARFESPDAYTTPALVRNGA